MAESEPSEIYICVRCVLPAPQGGICPQCGRTLVSCAVGGPDDPCRRPVMDAEGRLLTRAPLWWLRQRAAVLAARHECR